MENRSWTARFRGGHELSLPSHGERTVKGGVAPLLRHIPETLKEQAAILGITRPGSSIAGGVDAGLSAERSNGEAGIISKDQAGSTETIKYSFCNGIIQKCYTIFNPWIRVGRKEGGSEYEGRPEQTLKLGKLVGIGGGEVYRRHGGV